MAQSIYKVVLRGSLGAQETINRWDYVVDNTLAAPSALELLTLMGFVLDGGTGLPPADTVFAGLQDISCVDQKWEEVSAQEIYSTTDFYTIPYTPEQEGGHDAGAFSPFAAFGFFTNRVRTDIRRGFKRFGGVAEDAVDGLGIINATFVTAGAVLAGEMSAVLGSGSTLYKPGVLHLVKTTDGEGKVHRNYYPTVAEQIDHAAFPLTWSMYSTVRSQTSRQYGRGS